MKKVIFLVIFNIFFSTAFLYSFEEIQLVKTSEDLFKFNTNSKSKSEIILDLEVNKFKYEKVVEGNNTYLKPVFSGMGVLAGDGKPFIPIIRKKILIPKDGKVNFKISEIIWKEIKLENQLYPRQPSKSKAEENFKFFIDKKLYNTDTFYPNKDIISTYRKGCIRDHNFVAFDLVPFKYNPVTNILKIATQIKIKVSVTGDFNKAVNKIEKKYSKRFDKYLSHLFINYDSYKVKNSKFVREGMIILYGDNAFKQDIASQQDFTDVVEWKRKKGWKVEEYVVGVDVNNTASDIRTFVNSHYTSWTNPSLSYVLIVGDTDTVTTYDCGSHYSDQYYACLDGDFASDVRDRDIHFGRMSLVSSEVNTIIPIFANKILKFEKADYTDTSFFKKFELIAGHDSSNCAAFGYHTHESTRTNHTNNPANPYYPYTGTFPNDPEPGGDQIYSCVVTPQGDSQDIIDCANDGRILINYTAHGGETYWVDPNITISDVEGFTHAEANPFMIGHCCVTGSLNYSSDCFGEGVIKAANGPIAYLGGSNNTLWDEDDAMGRQMYDAIFKRDYNYTWGTPSDYGTYQGSLDVGTSLAALSVVGLDEVENYSSTNIDYYFEIYHLFGDPSLDFWTSEPDTFTVTPMPLSVGVPQYTLNVKDSSNQNVEGALVCLSNSEIYTVGTTDSSGNVTLTLNPVATVVGTADLVITKHDFKPAEESVQIIAGGCGVVMLDKESYNCSDLLTITLYDSDLSDNSIATQNVTLGSTSESAKTITLNWDGNLKYETTVQLVSSSPSSTQLLVSDSDTITVTYNDADCEGSGAIETDTATTDCQGPVISNVNWTSGLSKFTVTWDTNEPSTSKVYYSTSCEMNTFEESTSLTTSHSISLEDLTSSTYYIIIESTDGSGNTTIDNNSSACYEINIAFKYYIIDEPLDSNPGWTTTGANWEFGQPTGGCDTYNDPTSGFTGSNVYGINISGCYPDDVDTTEYLYSPIIDCSNFSEVYFEYQVWNGCESSDYDHEAVEISTNGTDWNTLWSNSGTFQDSAWSKAEFDLSSYAANQGSVQIRWAFGETDSSINRSGWNLDDIKLYVATTDTNLPTPTPYIPPSTNTPVNTPTMTSTPNCVEFESFDSETVPALPTNFFQFLGSSDTASNTWETTTSRSFSGTQSVYMTYDTSNIVDSYLVWGPIDLTGITNPSLFFQQNINYLSDMDIHELYASLSIPSDENDLTLIGDFPDPIEDTWTEGQIALTGYENNSTVYLAFRYSATNGDQWFLDDLCINVDSGQVNTPIATNTPAETNTPVMTPTPNTTEINTPEPTSTYNANTPEPTSTYNSNTPIPTSTFIEGTPEPTTTFIENTPINTPINTITQTENPNMDVNFSDTNYTLGETAQITLRDMTSPINPQVTVTSNTDPIGITFSLNGTIQPNIYVCELTFTTTGSSTNEPPMLLVSDGDTITVNYQGQCTAIATWNETKVNSFNNGYFALISIISLFSIVTILIKKIN